MSGYRNQKQKSSPLLFVAEKPATRRLAPGHAGAVPLLAPLSCFRLYEIFSPLPGTSGRRDFVRPEHNLCPFRGNLCSSRCSRFGIAPRADPLLSMWM